MARAKVVHSEDAVAIIFAGDKSTPEPSEARILFPGGDIGVTRTSDGNYWAHFDIERGRHVTPDMPGHEHRGEIVDARIDKENEHTSADSGAPLMDQHIEHVAILIRPIR